jgi:hypothetical protein
VKNGLAQLVNGKENILFLCHPIPNSHSINNIY